MIYHLNLRKLYPNIFFTSALCFIMMAVQFSQGITIADIEKAVLEANQANQAATKLEAHLKSLENKKTTLDNEIAQNDQLLSELKALTTPDLDKIKKTEKKQMALTQDLTELTNKIATAKTKAQASRERAKEAELSAKRMASERDLVQMTKKVEKEQQLLEYYKFRVNELEIAEREVRAEALAKTTMAAMSETQWERWRTEWDQSLSQGKADELLDQLMTYRIKISDSTKNITKAKEQLAAAQAEYEKYQQPAQN